MEEKQNRLTIIIDSLLKMAIALRAGTENKYQNTVLLEVLHREFAPEMEALKTMQGLMKQEGKTNGET